jgi:anti-sigma B factor antagonist
VPKAGGPLDDAVGRVDGAGFGPEKESRYVEEKFEVSQENGNGYVLVSVVGEVDVATAPELRDRLREAVVDGSPTVAVDLTEVTFIDSTALGVLIETKKLCDGEGRTMRIAVSEPRILKVFEITGLTELFDIRPTRDQAVVG